MAVVIEKKINIDKQNTLLIDALSQNINLSKQILKFSMEKGCVWVKHGKKTKRVRRAKKNLNKGDEVYIYYNEKILSSTTKQAEMILDKKSYSIWFKPAGVFSQGSKWGDHSALTRIVEKQLKRDTFLVHRLDRATSGLMLIAHNKQMAKALSDLFANRKIHKTYNAIVDREFKKNVTIDQPIDGKSAISHVSLLQYKEGKSLLSIDIETGRKHQIRKHLSGIGYPIIGDRMYGHADNNTKEDLKLQAVKLEYVCPIDKTDVSFEVDENLKLKL